MSAPAVTAWTFEFFRSTKPFTPVAVVTVETPTKLGMEHAERCAREAVRKIPRSRPFADTATATLRLRRSANEYRKEREDAIRSAKREMFDQPRS